MKALTVKQPWASLMFTPLIDPSGAVEGVGLKTLETRSWSTNYRGELLITTSLKPDKEYMALSHLHGVCRYCGCVEERACNDGCSWVHYFYRDLCSTCQKLELNGYAVGVVKLVDCIDYDETMIDQGCILLPDNGLLKAWVLEDPIPIVPFKIKGKLGLWEAPYARHNLAMLSYPLHPDYNQSDLPF